MCGSALFPNLALLKTVNASYSIVHPLLHNLYIPNVIVNCPMNHTCVLSDVRRWCREGEVRQLRDLFWHLLGILFNYVSYTQELYTIERDHHRSPSGDCFAECDPCHVSRNSPAFPWLHWEKQHKNKTGLCPGPCLVDLCPGDDVQFAFCMVIRTKVSAFL